MSERAKRAAERERAEREQKRNRNRIIIVVLLIAIAAVAAWYITQVFIPAQNYRAAEAAEAEGDLTRQPCYGRGDIPTRAASFALWEHPDRETSAPESYRG